MASATEFHMVFFPVEERDLAFFRVFLKNPLVTRWLPVNEPCTEEEVRLHHIRRLEHWEKRGFGTWMLREDGKAAPFGYCGLEHVCDSEFIDLRYGLLPHAQGKGLALKASRDVLKKGFSRLGLERIYGASMHENRASVKILKDLGMKEDFRFDLYGENLFCASVDAESFYKTL